MLQSFLVSLAMAVLKHYATLAGQEIIAYIKEQEELQKAKIKADEYRKCISQAKTRKERQDAEDSLLN